MVTKFLVLAAGLYLTYGCHQGSEKSAPSADSTRTAVQTQAVAAYDQKVNDTLNHDWYFSVQLYETPKLRDYVVQMIFEEMHDVDTVHFPDLGYPVKPALQKGPDSLSCYIGFLDPKGQFMYYKAVYVDKKALHLRTVRKYTVKDEE